MKSFDPNVEYRGATVSIDTTKLTNGIHFPAHRGGQGREGTRIARRAEGAVPGPERHVSADDDNDSDAGHDLDDVRDDVRDTDHHHHHDYHADHVDDVDDHDHDRDACHPAVRTQSCDQQITAMKSKISQATSILTQP